MNPELMFHTEDEVMFYDTDCGGVVHNLAYLRMIEACRTKLGAKLGMDYKTMSDLQQFAVVVRHEIDYVRPAVLGDTACLYGISCITQDAALARHLEKSIEMMETPDERAEAETRREFQAGKRSIK